MPAESKLPSIPSRLPAPSQGGFIVRAHWRMAIVILAALAAGFVVNTWAPQGAQSEPSFFASRCASCHSDDNPTCAGCHEHRGILSVATDRPSYAPGEQVTVTLISQGAVGWIRALLYNESNVEIDRKAGPTGTGDDMQPNPVVFPVVLHGAAPAQPGTYTWNAAWYGNTGNGGPTHGEVRRSFQVVVNQPTAIPEQGSPIVESTWGLIKSLFD